MFHNESVVMYNITLTLLLILSITLASPLTTLSTNLQSRNAQTTNTTYENDHNNPPNHLNELSSDKPILILRGQDYDVLYTGLTPGWELDFYEYDWGYLPISTASFALQAFYHRVIHLALATSDQPPQHSVIRWGQLDLEIVVSHGSITWVSVAAFARHMLETARRGYTNTYHCHMTNLAAGVYVTFNLYVRVVRELPPPVPEFRT